MSEYISKLGNESLVISSSGNVGIGTTDPKSLLHIDTNSGIGTIDPAYSINIRGDGIDGIQILSDESFSGRIVFGDQNSNTVGQIRYDHSTDAFRFFTSGTEKVSILSDGNVGIGATAPDYNLHVSGSTTATIGLEGTGGNKDTWEITSTDLGGKAVLNFRNDDVSSTILTLNQDSNVGIGATEPAHKLDVSGSSARIGGNFTTTTLYIQACDTGGAPAATNRIIMQGYSNRAQGIFYENTTYTPEEWFSGITYNNGNNTWQVGYDASAGCAEYSDKSILTVKNTGNVGIGGIPNPASSLHVSSSNNVNIVKLDVGTKATYNFYANSTSKYTTLFNMDDTGLDIGHDSTLRSLNLKTGNIDRVTILGTGNVGINTVDPQGKLDINTEDAEPTHVYINGEVNQNKLLYFRHYANSEAAANNVALGYIGSNGIDNLLSLGHLNSSGTDVPIMHLTEAGNVGIGTTSPLYKLDVSGSIRSVTTSGGTSFRGVAEAPNSDYTALRISNDTVSDSANFGFSIKYMGTRSGNLNSLSIFSDNCNGTQVEAVSIMQDGNVGIGTSDAGAPLELNPSGDSISGAPSKALIISNKNDTSWTVDALTAYNATTGYDITDLDSLTFFSRPTGGNILTFASETANNGTLHRFVNLNSSATEPLYRWDFFQYDGSGTGSDNFKIPDKLFQIRVKTGASITEKFTITGNGNVGINTNDPSEKLTVDGSISASGDLYLDGGIFDTNDSTGTSGQILSSTGTTVDWVDASEVGIVDGDGTLNCLAKWTPDGNSLGDSIVYDDGTCVGIGTSTPNYKSHVWQSTNGDVFSLVQNPNAGVSARVGLNLLSDAGSLAGLTLTSQAYTGVSGWCNRLILNTDSNISNGILIRPSNGGLTISTSGIASNDLHVEDDTGNVGIGTDTPSYNLDVIGDLSSNGKSIASYRRLRSYDTFTTPTNNDAGWYPLFSWGTTTGDRGGYRFYISYTGGSWTPNTTVLKVFKNWSGDATVTIEKYGGSTYITDVRVIGDAPSATVYTLELYLTSQAVGHNFNVYYEALGYDEGGPSNVSWVTSSLLSSSNTGTELINMPVASEGISTQNIIVKSCIDIASQLRHLDDENTYFQFHNNDNMRLVANSVQRFNIETTETVVNEDSANLDFRVEGNTDQHLLFADANTDRVGIGTATPEQKLHVNLGRIAVSDGYNIGDTDADTGMFTNLNNLYLQTANSTRATISSSGNVGIGTTGPNYKLHTVGGAGVFDVTSASGLDHHLAVTEVATLPDWRPYEGTSTSALQLQSSATRGILLAAKSTGNQDFYNTDGLDIYVSSSIGSTAANRGNLAMSISSSGNVGIGTTSPVTSLHVQSSETNIARFSGLGTAGTYIKLDESGTQAWVMGIDNGDTTLKIRKNDYNGDVSVSFASNQQLQFNAYGSGTFAGTACQRLAVDSSGNVIEIPIGSGAVDGSGATNKVAYWTDTDTLSGSVNFHWDDVNERLGIGTTDPEYKLDVNTGLSSGEGISYPIRVGHGSMATVGDGVGVLFSRGSAEQYFGYVRIQSTQSNPDFLNPRLEFGIQDTDTFNLADASTRMVITGDGNVGIGTTSPDALLELSSSTAQSLLNVNEGYLYVSGSGKVGIGTPNPNQLLDVDGITRIRRPGTTTTEYLDIEVNDSVALFSITQDESAHGGFYFLLDDNSGSSTSSAFRISNSTPTDLLTVRSDGKVGIGIPNPDSTLHIKEIDTDEDAILKISPNNGSYDPVLQLTPQDGTLDTEGFEIWYDNNVGDAHIHTTYNNDAAAIRFHTRTGASKSTSNERLTIAGDGNVGIGTTDPAEKLHVTETIRAGSAGNSSANLPALRVYASGANPEQSSIAIQQGTTVGDTIIFADYEPYVEYGINTDNGDDTIEFTAGTSTNNLGSKTLYNNSGSARTAYKKVIISLLSGNMSVGGNVGIGAASPSNKLEVQQLASDQSGAAAIKAIGTAYGTNKTIHAYMGTTSNTKSLFYAENSNGVVMNVAGDGNVGIGTTSPNKKLSVSGEVSGSSHATFDGRVRSNTELRVSADYSINYFYKADNTTILGYLLMRDDNNSLLSFPAGQDFRLMHANTTRIAVASAGDVGIGTTSPNQKLTVAGNISASGDLYLDGGIYDTNNSLGISGQVLSSTGAAVDWIDNPGVSGTGAANKVAFWTGTDTLSNNSNFHWDDTNERLGIGAATPNSCLQITQTSFSSQVCFTQAINFSGLLIDTNYTADHYTPGLFWRTNNNETTKPKAGIYLTNSSAGSCMLFGTSNNYSVGITNDAVLINPLGNVGIGTTNPNQKLTVAGNISASGDLYLDGGIFDTNDSTGTSGQILSSTGTAVDWINNTTGTVTSVTVGTGLDVSNGTTTPNITLDLSELTDMTADIIGTDEVILLDNGAERKKSFNELKLSVFNNDSGWTDCTGTVTSVSSATTNQLTVAGTTTPSLSIVTNAVADAGTALATGDQIHDFVTTQGYTTCEGDITNVIAGTGLSGGGTDGDVTLNIDLSELTDMTVDIVGTDEVILLDGGADRRKAFSELKLSVFNNDSGWTDCTGTVTSVSSATTNQLTVAGTTTPSLSIVTGAVVDAGTALATGDQIHDFVTTQGYTTCEGDITNVIAGTGLSGGGTDGDVTLNVDLSELTDMTVDIVGTDEVILLDGGADRRKAFSELKLSVFNNDSGWTDCTGTVTGTGSNTRIAKWTGTNSIGESNIYDDGTRVGIGAVPNTGGELLVNGGGSTFLEVENASGTKTAGTSGKQFAGWLDITLTNVSTFDGGYYLAIYEAV